MFTFSTISYVGISSGFALQIKQQPGTNYLIAVAKSPIVKVDYHSVGVDINSFTEANMTNLVTSLILIASQSAVAN